MRWFGLLLCLLLGPAAFAQTPRPPFIVILLPGTSLDEWRATGGPNLHRLMGSGALAVMNTRTARLPNDHTRETPESAALTLGTGARAAGGPEASDFLMQSATIPGLTVSAGDLYARRTGKLPPPGRYVNVHWPALLRANERLGYRLRLGALADALAVKGISVSAGGGRFADCIATRSDGTVGRAESLTTASGPCLVWDAGTDIPAADNLIGRAAAQVARLHGRLLLLSPFAGDTEYARGERLTPVLEWGEGIPAGLLRSPSTHRAGLVVSTDFAPTVGAYYGVRREDFAVRPFGEVWTEADAPDAERSVRALEGQAVRQAGGMKVLPYLAVALAFWMIGGTALALLKRMPFVGPVVPAALLTALVFSVSFLSLALWSGLLLATAAALKRRLGPRRVILALSAVLAASLVGDMLTGGRLMQRGLLGYSAIEGARYYGIGNEAMGALIGALLVVTARLWRPFGRAQGTLLVMLGVVALLLGSAGAGAKAGGLLVSLTAFGTLGVGLLGKRWSVPMALVLGVGAASALGLAAVHDAAAGPGSHSHMGEAIRRIQMGGWSEGADIMGRKLAVEGRLAFHSAWAFPLWAGLLCQAAVWRKRRGITPEARALRVAGLVGIAACVALNDAGVIAGVLCLVSLWCDSIANILSTDSKKKPLEPHSRFQGPPSEGALY